MVSLYTTWLCVFNSIIVIVFFQSPFIMKTGSNPPSANFFRLLCSVHLPQKVRGIFGLKTQKTGPGLAVIAIPKPVFAGFTVFWTISALKARKLPDLSGRQIRQLLCDNSTKRNIEKGVCSKSIRYVFRMADTKNSY